MNNNNNTISGSPDKEGTNPNGQKPTVPPKPTVPQKPPAPQRPRPPKKPKAPRRP